MFSETSDFETCDCALGSAELGADGQYELLSNFLKGGLYRGLFRVI